MGANRVILKCLTFKSLLYTTNLFRVKVCHKIIWFPFRVPLPENLKRKMQLDVEVSPSAFVRAQLELECTCSVPELYMQC